MLKPASSARRAQSTRVLPSVSGTAFGRPIPTSMLNLHRRSTTRSRTDSNPPPSATARLARQPHPDRKPQRQRWKGRARRLSLIRALQAQAPLATGGRLTGLSPEPKIGNLGKHQAESRRSWPPAAVTAQPDRPDEQQVIRSTQTASGRKLP